MKRKFYYVLLILCLIVSTCACNNTQEKEVSVSPSPTEIPLQTPVITVIPTAEPTAVPTTVPSEIPTETPIPQTIVSPLPTDIDITNLDNCTVAVSFDKGDAYVDDTGILRLKVKVYTYDIFDIASISLLKEGDIIILRGQEVEISSLVRTEHGAIQINGGMDAEGYELISDDSTVFFENGYSDEKAYYEIGEAILRVSSEFLFTDSSDLDLGEVTYYPGDFLTDDSGILYSFSPNNTTVTIENGQVITMNRVYTP